MCVKQLRDVVVEVHTHTHSAETLGYTSIEIHKILTQFMVVIFFYGYYASASGIEKTCHMLSYLALITRWLTGCNMTHNEAEAKWHRQRLSKREKKLPKRPRCVYPASMAGVRVTTGWSHIYHYHQV